jgi:hypothetical protein
VLTKVVDPCNEFEFEKCFQRTYPALATWANSNNTSGKPAGAIITILLMLACTEWQSTPPVSTLILPCQIRNSTSFPDIGSFMMSYRSARTTEKYKPNFSISSGPPSTGFSNAARRAKLYDKMQNERASSMPRSPSGDTPSPFSSVFPLLPTINAPGADDFYIGDEDNTM